MKNNFLEGSPFKLILTFSIPMIIGNVFQQLYSTVDSIIVGNFVGANALAAVGGSFAVQFLILAIAFGFTIGLSVILAQVFGARDMQKVKTTFSTGMILILCLATVLAIIGYFISEPVLRLIDTPESILPDSVIYLQIMFLGLPAMFFYNFYASALRAIGDSKTPLYFLIIATIINIVLDYVFVAFFGMGVMGVALATLIAQLVSGVLSHLYVRRKIEIFQFKKGEFVFDKEIAKAIIKYGVPSAVQQSIVSLGFLAVQSFVNYFGADMTAAFSTANRIESFVTMPMMNLASALSMFAGQNIGANKEDRALKGIKVTVAMQIVFCGAMIIIIPIAAEFLLALFGLESSPRVMELGLMGVRFSAYFYVVFAVFQTLSQFHRGVGDTTFAMIVSILMIVVRIPATYLSIHYFEIGEIAIWVGMVSGWMSALLFNALRFFSGKWRGKAFVQKDVEAVSE